MELNELLLQWSALAGFAALIALAINVLKAAGVVKDGDAPTWSAALNLAGLAGLLALRVYKPEIDVGGLDAQAAELAQVLTVIFGYVLQLLAAKATHIALRGAPLVGTSHTE